MNMFQPAIPLSGYSGWRVLEKSAPRQREVFEKSPRLNREIQYFRENIKGALTAEALIKDRRLLSVALGAFGLGDEIDKKAFIRKILEDGTEKQEALANRLNEPRYKAFAKAFGYGNVGGTSVLLSAFREDIVARYRSLEFERAVGEVDNDMRLAMNFKREVATIASAENVDRVGWFQLMGQAPLRTLIVKAFGLPDSIAQIDVDKQKQAFERKADALYGGKSPAVFANPDNVEDIIRRFFLFRQLESGPSASTPGAAAVTLLQSNALSGAAIANILLSKV